MCFFCVCPNCQNCRFTASSKVKFLCFITLSASFPHLTSLRPRQRLPSALHVIILSRHLLSYQCTTFRTFSTGFTVLPKLFVLPAFLPRRHHILLLVMCSSLQLFPTYPFLCSTVSSLACNPVAKFASRNFERFLSLYEIFVPLHSPKDIYCTAALLSVLVAVLACSVLF